MLFGIYFIFWLQCRNMSVLDRNKKYGYFNQRKIGNNKGTLKKLFVSLAFLISQTVQIKCGK